MNSSKPNVPFLAAYPSTVIVHGRGLSRHALCLRILFIRTVLVEIVVAGDVVETTSSVSPVVLSGLFFTLASFAP